MTPEFDPYHKWLGIPPKDQPPNHYRLLGLDLFEPDLDVIEAAAFRQTAHVRTYQLGPHSDFSQKLLNEIAAAKVCLMDPQTRADYDEELRARLRAADGRRSVPPAVAPSPIIAPPVVPARPVVLAVGQKPAKSVRRKKAAWPVYAGLGAVALLLVVLLAVVMSGPGPDELVDSGQQGATEDPGAGVADAHPPAGSGPGLVAAPPSEDKPPVQQQAQQTLAAPEQNQPSPPEEAVSVTPSPPTDAGASGEMPSGDLKPDESPDPQIPTIPPLPPDAEDQLKEELAQAKSPQNFRAIADKALRYVDQAIAASDAETAQKLVAWAVAAARESADAELSKTAALRYLELQTPLTEDVVAAAKKRLGTYVPEVGASESTDSAAVSAPAPQRSLADLVKAEPDSGEARPHAVGPGAAAGVPQTDGKKPMLLSTKTELFARHPNYARHDGLTFDVGIANEFWGVGIAAVGYEFENVVTLRYEVKINGKLKAYDQNAFVGFMVDYHTPTGYSKRVALSLGMYFRSRHGVPQKWGTAKRPDDFVDLTYSPTNLINLREWAPADWDGKVWFCVLNEHGGKNTSMTGRLIIPELR